MATATGLIMGMLELELLLGEGAESLLEAELARSPQVPHQQMGQGSQGQALERVPLPQVTAEPG